MNYIPNSTHLVEILPADYLTDLRRTNAVLESQIKALAKVSFHAIIGTGHGRPGPWDLWVMVEVAEGKETTVCTLYDGRTDIDENEKVSLMGYVAHERYRFDGLTAVVKHLNAQSEALVKSLAPKPATTLVKGHTHQFTITFPDPISSSDAQGLMEEWKDLVNNALPLLPIAEPSLTPPGIKIDDDDQIAHTFEVSFSSGDIAADPSAPDTQDLAEGFLADMAAIASKEALELKAYIQSQDDYTPDQIKRLVRLLFDIQAEIDHVKTSVNESLEHLISGIK